MIIIQARQLVETEVPPQLQRVRLMLHLLSPYPHALCFSLNSTGFLSQSEWPADYLLWRREKIRRRERYCRYTQWEREWEKHFLTMGLEIAVRVRCYPEDKYGYSRKHCVPITASHFSTGPPEPESSKRVKDVRTSPLGSAWVEKHGKVERDQAVLWVFTSTWSYRFYRAVEEVYMLLQHPVDLKLCREAHSSIIDISDGGKAGCSCLILSFFFGESPLLEKGYLK